MQSISAEIEAWNFAGYLNLRDHQMLLFILHKQSMTGESGIASGTIAIQMHALHEVGRHVFIYIYIYIYYIYIYVYIYIYIYIYIVLLCVEATTMVSTSASEQQLELSAHSFKAKLLVEMKTRGEPVVTRHPSEGYEPGTPSAPVLSDQALRLDAVLSPAVLGEGAVLSPAVPLMETGPTGEGAVLSPAVPLMEAGPTGEGAVLSPAVPLMEAGETGAVTGDVSGDAVPTTSDEMRMIDWELLQYHLRTVCHSIVEFEHDFVHQSCSLFSLCCCRNQLDIPGVAIADPTAQVPRHFTYTVTIDSSVAESAIR